MGELFGVGLRRERHWRFGHDDDGLAHMPNGRAELTANKQILSVCL
jgi:hypothetical protein